MAKADNALGLSRSRIRRIKKVRKNWGSKSPGLTQSVFR